MDGTANDGWRINDDDEASGNYKTVFRTREEVVIIEERPNLEVTYQ